MAADVHIYLSPDCHLLVDLNPHPAHHSLKVFYCISLAGQFTYAHFPCLTTPSSQCQRTKHFQNSVLSTYYVSLTMEILRLPLYHKYDFAYLPAL